MCWNALSAVSATAVAAAAVPLLLIGSAQVSTAHFAVIVEDDPDLWMPQNGAPGCSQVRQLLATAPDMILDITLLFFKYTAGEHRSSPASSVAGGH